MTKTEKNRARRRRKADKKINWRVVDERAAEQLVNELTEIAAKMDPQIGGE